MERQRRSVAHQFADSDFDEESPPREGRAASDTGSDTTSRDLSRAPSTELFGSLPAAREESPLALVQLNLMARFRRLTLEVYGRLHTHTHTRTATN